MVGRARSITLAIPLAFLLAGEASAQAIGRDEYLRYMPLEYPRLLRGTEAPQRMLLYGDPRDPDYRDVSPRDGIDDTRHAFLEDLSVRFAPFMAKNTTAVPMDFKLFMNGRTAFPLFVDTWDVSRGRMERIDTETVDFNRLDGASCQTAADYTDRRDSDCVLRRLLEEYHPDHPTNSRFNTAAQANAPDSFRVMFFDFPGDDEESWKEAYTNAFNAQLPRALESFTKVYVHPFVHIVEDNTQGVLGYEFALQYWFFYPFNDGGNNHEGDWEHINVVIAPRNRVTEHLSETDLSAMLHGTVDAQLVMKRVEYYFHSQVMSLDFARPNAYQPRAEWEAEKKALGEERHGEYWLVDQIRRMAYIDKEETAVNTHPIAYIGADNKGPDQFLAPPGGRNRDSHGTFPFPGSYRDVGPAGATEQITTNFDHRDYFGDPTRPLPDWVERFDDPTKIEILPAWERIIDLVRDEPEVRRDWSWLVLPIRWGYPAAVSPFGGIVPHAETGNLAVPGPAHNKGWSRVDGESGSNLYEPHRYLAVLPLGFEDNIKNQLGVFNLVTAPLLTIPPFDILSNLVSAPFRALFGGIDQVFYPRGNVPFRFLGVHVPISIHRISDDFTLLFFNHAQLPALQAQVVAAGLDTSFVITGISELKNADNAVSPEFRFSIFLGDRLVTENSLRHSRSLIQQEILTIRDGPAGPTPELFGARADLNMWEYAGSIRYNMATGGFQPFLRAGYGLSWYRLENTVTVTGDGEETPLDPADSPWIRRPTLSPLKNILPNTWHVGFGFEWIPVRSFSTFPKGVDIGIRGEYALFRHKLGFNQDFVDPTIDSPVGEQIDPSISRSSFQVGLTISF